MSITISGNASATPSYCLWVATSVTGHRVKGSPASTTSASTTLPTAGRKPSPRSWNDVWTYRPRSTKTSANASASWSPAIWISAVSTTVNLPHEVDPFDRAISVRTFLRPLAQHLQDPKVTEIAIEREGHLYARTDGHWLSHDCEELSYQHLEALATALAAYNHMARSPIMSVVLPDGERGQIILPPACIDGTIAINIRKHATETFYLKQLASGGAFKATMDATAKYGADGLSEVDQRLLLLK